MYASLVSRRVQPHRHLNAYSVRSLSIWDYFKGKQKVEEPKDKQPTHEEKKLEQ